MRAGITHRLRRGASAVTVAMSMTLLFAFSALVVDIGYARVIQVQIQSATDAGALAAVRALDQRSTGVSRARAAAVELARLNLADGAAVTVSPNNTNVSGGGVVTGVWNRGAFTPSTDSSVVNAVYVTASLLRPASGLTAVALGSRNEAVRARSIAVQGMRLGASEVPWYLPFGIPKCVMQSWSGTKLASMTFVLNPATADNVGWAILGGSVSTSALRGVLDAAVPCVNDWYATGMVSHSCPTVRISDVVSLGNGADQSALQELATLMTQGVPWDSTVWGALPARGSSSAIPVSSYGKTMVGPLPVFDGGSGYCAGNEPWNGTAAVTGFVWAAIYDVRTTGAVENRNVWVKIDPVSYRDIATAWGGPDYGVTWRAPPALVQ
jgi:Flp pilus assembly protein TadG